MEIKLTPDLDEFVTAKVNSGHYGSSSEVVKSALRMMRAVEELGEADSNIHSKEILRKLKLEMLRGAILEGQSGSYSEVN